MRMQGEQRIARPPAAVWAALNDPEILKGCIPGCETLEKLSDTAYQAAAAVRVGPVQARFKGKITLSDMEPPHRYRISGEGQGGAAGFVRGGADVRLEPVDGATCLHYTVDATVGGKLAQMGGRVVDQAARQMADTFFSNLNVALTEPQAAAPEVPAATRLLPVPMWIALAIAMAVFALYLVGLP